MQSAESQIAHNQREEAAPETILGEESNAAIGGLNKAISDEKGETLFHSSSLAHVMNIRESTTHYNTDSGNLFRFLYKLHFTLVTQLILYTVFC